MYLVRNDNRNDAQSGQAIQHQLHGQSGQHNAEHSSVTPTQKGPPLGASYSLEAPSGFCGQDSLTQDLVIQHERAHNPPDSRHTGRLDKWGYIEYHTFSKYDQVRSL